MPDKPIHIFTGSALATAYAMAAERIWGGNNAYLESNPAVVPVFVCHLFQSLEISIKAAGIESGLFTKQEARSGQNRSGHGIRELVALAVKKLGGDPFEPIVMAMTFCNKNERSAEFITSMICGEGMSSTREAYATRRLGYGEVGNGDFALIRPVDEWIASVRQTAANVITTVCILRQWKASPSKSKHFAIWMDNNRGHIAVATGKGMEADNGAGEKPDMNRKRRIEKATVDAFVALHNRMFGSDYSVERYRYGSVLQTEEMALTPQARAPV